MTICSGLLEIKTVLNKGTCDLWRKVQSLMIAIWMLGNRFVFITCCQTSHDQVIAIWSLPCWFPQKVGGIEASFLSFWCCKFSMPKFKQDFQTQTKEICLSFLGLKILFAKIQVGFSIPEWGDSLCKFSKICRPKVERLAFHFGFENPAWIHHGWFSDSKQRGRCPFAYWLNTDGNGQVAVASLNNCFGQQLRFQSPLWPQWL